MNIRRAIRRIQALEIGVYAANASFFILLSIFPGMMLSMMVLRYTPVFPEDLESALSSILPQPLYPLLDYMVQQLYSDESITLMSLTAVTALWTASKGIYSFSRGLNRVYRVKETRGTFFFRLRCVGFTLALLLALFLTISLHLFRKELSMILQNRRQALFRVLAAVLQMRYITIVCFLTGLFSLFYTVFPNKRISWSASLPGAFAAAAAWVVFTQLFSFYAARFGRYSLYYGSLSVIAMAMLWLYICMSILLYGAVLNTWLLRLRSG